MKKVFQTIIDKDNGNCMQAAIASLLELELNEVPHFKELGTNWFNGLWKFLKEKGYEFNGTVYNQLHSQTGIHLFDRINEDIGVKGLFFATVYSPAYYNKADTHPTTHAVIINKKFEIVHDVNPNNKSNIKYPLADELGYNGIVNYLLITPINV